ncbi:hypothetical protein LPC08_10640 [Roseomonas sp. OT10]|uniref:hypothetical protein n=1 Tax=Roseomonas cutis TaxID=2897332 RepID=UPI001E58B126|nr:hypothetical protein [Roseomonas sp. OT10]UFN51026.1 hypothetical protein LPC08_10640 [Roseomonas sp. OT10]
MAACGPLLGAGTETAAGIAGAGIASAVTSNATVATGIGLGVSAGARAGLQYAQRRVHRDAQNAVAQAAGRLAPGQVGRWSVSHAVPIEPDGRGRVTVVRELGGAGFACREIVFSDEETDGPGEAFFTAMVCRNGDTWRWATAEPATERWGSLQ